MYDMSMKLRLNCLTPPTVLWFLINEPAGPGGTFTQTCLQNLPLSEGGWQPANPSPVFCPRDPVLSNEVLGLLRGQIEDGGGRVASLLVGEYKVSSFNKTPVYFTPLCVQCVFVMNVQHKYPRVCACIFYTVTFWGVAGKYPLSLLACDNDSIVRVTN